MQALPAKKLPAVKKHFLVSVGLGAVNLILTFSRGIPT
jgi:hypothetical protein